MTNSKIDVTHSVESHLLSIFGFANRLANEFYANTFNFEETLNYVFLINSINTEAYKILKNPDQAAVFCGEMNKNLLISEAEFSAHPALKQMIRSLYFQNTFFIKGFTKKNTEN